MTEKQRQKHITDTVTVLTPEGSSLDSAPTSPDGLGTWEGGLAKGANNWVALKSHATNTGDAKNAHGNNNHLGPKPITHRQDADFNEIHTNANGDFFLYNVKNDKWDIPTDAKTVPFYEDENGKTWAYNYKTGAWDVEVTEEIPEEHVADPTPAT